MNTPLSETDARRKWCPFVRFAKFDGEAPHNRSSDFLNDAPRYCCIASDCMAWRWIGANPGNPNSQPYLPTDHRATGYCGLAGS